MTTHLATRAGYTERYIRHILSGRPTSRRAVGCYLAALGEVEGNEEYREMGLSVLDEITIYRDPAAIEIADELALIRAELGMSIPQMARLLMVGESAVTRYEAGCLPRADVIGRYAMLSRQTSRPITEQRLAWLAHVARRRRAESRTRRAA